jgi:hypothetical protein
MMAKVSQLNPEIKNEIQTFLHCKKCMKELPPDTSPQEFIHVEVGWTAEGIQVWCLRHDLNVIHMDFEGHQHPAK